MPRLPRLDREEPRTVRLVEPPAVERVLRFVCTACAWSGVALIEVDDGAWLRERVVSRRPTCTECGRPAVPDWEAVA